jgi:hypothetical protein
LRAFCRHSDYLENISIIRTNLRTFAHVRTKVTFVTIWTNLRTFVIITLVIITLVIITLVIITLVVITLVVITPVVIIPTPAGTYFYRAYSAL